jgi:hypothetical protein
MKHRHHFLRKQAFWEPIVQHWLMCSVPRLALGLLLGGVYWLGESEALPRLIQLLAN